MIIVYFSIYCFLGYWLESCYISLFQRKWVSSGLLKGPFIPLYGFGACLLMICLPYIQALHPFFNFFLSGILLTLLELLASYYIEKFFHTRCWDYSHHFLHFQGRICLIYFLIWCVMGSLFIYVIHPFMISLHLVNDATCLISLIYLSLIIKAYGDRLLHNRHNGIKIH